MFIFDELPPQLIMMLYSFSESILHLRLYLSFTLLRTIPSLGLSLPSLQTLLILSTDAGIIDEPLELFPVCPQLRELGFVDVNDPTHYLSLPWEQVTDYRWYYCNEGTDTSAHVSSLKKMIRLRNCVLQCAYPTLTASTNRAMDPSLCRKIRLLDLQSDFDRVGQIALRQVMDRLTLPELLQLRVACPKSSTEYARKGVFAAIRCLIDRSLPPLTVFHFSGGGHIAVEDLCHIISSLHMLEDFQLTGLDKDTITTEVVTAFMTHPPSGTINVPQLRILHLSGVAKAGVYLLADMIQSRLILEEGSSNPVSRLKSVKIDTDYDFLEEYSHMTNQAHDIGGWIKHGLVCEFNRYV
ncbi:hypothetical protein EDD18DRAFT_1355293 [Armillaria luteobubalina]|uniref:F-box domain-containing protein n=1 Tax=Armillaria luteobubalina TaxID=153913 RepID=A0AA39Q492_9AGAR|nr:hypothetical protein EDD18DRAFT_1355293 [Armillaria luteobubalina]